MITANNISNIKGVQLFHNRLKVKKIGKDVFQIIGFNYGDEEKKFTGHADEVAKYLNEYFGNRSE